MLSDTAFRSAIADGQIRLTYTFMPDAGGTFHEQPTPLDAAKDGTATALFDRSLTRSRLALTLGPLVRPLSRVQSVSRRIRYGGHPHIVDLRKASSGWVLLPGQSAVVFSNEHVRLPSDLVGLIVGRVSSYHTGLITSASFIDSTWEGLVELHLTNTSRRSVHLRIGLEIGRLFVLPAPGGTIDSSSVSQQGLHYGFNWPRILADEIDPFPHGAAPKARSIAARLDNMNEFFQRYAGYGLATVLLAAAFAAVPLYSQVQQALAVSDQVDRHDQTIASIQSRTPLTGTEDIAISAGETLVSVTVNLPGDSQPPTAAAYVAAEIHAGDPDAAARASIRVSGGQTAIVLTVQVERPADASRTVTIGWIYVP